MPLEIPKTIARLQPYIKIYATIGGYEPNQLDPLSPDFSNVKFDLIGAVQKIDISMDRSIGTWRELNKDTFGRFMETYPNLIGSYDLTLERVILNESNFLEAFGFVGSDLLLQTRPLVISLELFGPDETKVKTYKFDGCWFKANPFTFDINSDDLKIIQSIGATARGVTEA